MLPDLQTYLSSKDPAPRTFTFDRLTFEPGSSDVQPADEQTIHALANAFKRHADVQARVIGYDDGQRSRQRHPGLGEQRAAAIVLALQTAGVSRSRLEPLAGRQDNGERAAQLVIVQK
jgi:outer membrane protein OmpA-like peptidoglycan-associated protein